MEIQALNDQDLLAKLNELVIRERKLTVQVLFYLGEVEQRGLHRDLGYSSLFEYCTKVLKFSDGSAYRRVSAARCLKSDPSIAERIESGELTLSSLTMAAKGIEGKLISVTEISGCSKREVEAIVARVNPIEVKPRESIKAVAVKGGDLPLFGFKQEERIEIRFSLSKEEYQRLEEAKSRLSNSLGKDHSVEAVVGKLLDGFLKPIKVPKVEFLPESETRYVPKALRRAVFARDNGQCTYTSPDGHRCEAKSFLQIDHVIRFSVGGRTEISNLRLLCSCHNQLMAERYFGKELMGHFSGEVNCG